MSPYSSKALNYEVLNTWLPTLSSESELYTSSLSCCCVQVMEVWCLLTEATERSIITTYYVLPAMHTMTIQCTHYACVTYTCTYTVRYRSKNILRKAVNSALCSLKKLTIEKAREYALNWYIFICLPSNVYACILLRSCNFINAHSNCNSLHAKHSINLQRTTHAAAL